MKILYFLPVLIMILLIPTAIILEKRDYNRGFCKECGGRLKLFSIDSQGGRGYWCRNCNYHTWVSYNCVDKFGR